MNDLVERLSQGEHPVEITLRPARTFDAFKGCLERRFVHVKFTDTRGGTELGVKIKEGDLDLSSANLEQATGTVKLSGELTLNFERVKLVAEISLPELSGCGRLIPLH